jgi:hypothetical protein
MRALVVIAVLTVLVAQVIDGRIAVALGVVALILWFVTAPIRRAGAIATRLQDAVGPVEIGTHRFGWDRAVGQVFRVLAFDRRGTAIEGDKVTPRSRVGAYGYLHVESPVLPVPPGLSPELARDIPARLPIVHKDDFRLADTVFSEPRLVDAIEERQVELLVTYKPKRVGPNGMAIGFEHFAHFVLVPPGTLDRYYAKPGRRASPELESLFGELVYTGNITVGRNANPSLGP